MKKKLNCLTLIIAASLFCCLSACTENGTNAFEDDTNTFELSENSFSSFTLEVDAAPLAFSKLPNGLDKYGDPFYIDFVVNSDNTITALWLDSSNKKYMAKISLETKSIVEKIIIPEKANNQKRFLGFDAIAENTYIVGYSKTNSYGNDHAEAWYTAFKSDGTELYSTRIFGDNDMSLGNSKGYAGQRGCSVVRYNASNNSVALYLPHRQRWADDMKEHQASWVGFLNATTGELLKNSKGNRVGSDWYCSHNFDQRCIASTSGNFYTLAHGDAYPRALQLAKWNTETGASKTFDYYKIKYGSFGQNETKATTGDLVELTNGNIAIVYSTEDDRSSRDLRISVVSSLEDVAMAQDTWVTTLTSGEKVGRGSKLIQIDSESILLGWNTFNSSGVGIASHFALASLDGTQIKEIASFDQPALYPAQSFRKSADGKHVIYVSEEDGKLKINMIAIN